MLRFALAVFLSTGVYGVQSVHATQSVDIEAAANIYREAAMREQVRASLGPMPDHIRQLFSTDSAAKLSDQQLNAVTAAAKRGFRIDVFEAPALNALAANLDETTLKKTDAFLMSDLGRRMVAADVATSQLDENTIDKIMNGQMSAPSTAQREVLFDKLEQAARSSESTVQIFLSMGQAVAIGTAVGSGRDTASVAESARKSGEASRADLEHNMRVPLRRFLAYSYRDMSDGDLKHLLAFLVSAPGKRYVSAYIASLGAGFDAMGRRCGEQLGESLRELAQAQLDVPIAGPAPPAIAAPTPARPQ